MDEDPMVGFAVGTSRPGVTIDSVRAGAELPEGVEACSVANRSGVEEERMGRLHPANKRKRKILEKSLSLLIIQFNSLEIKFFAR